ncbi:glycoside hydrolase family 3 C-terminal domain-containing protein [Homoserinibacter sp. GY 40078]|uniref:beta-glucosidase H n=1 Tax=Homoserinibacter sp. GY 40078 TaxID=2603275 RepID=UPI0011C9AB73|nr:glycoside hydrolase family 3 C-terminal domain-containing protein [Homoserinibacter sp. GY 40078]TXK16400.1 glycoside hydrolase family 3 protein [Homoserinibacter sp. GY 40078]
MTDPIRSDDPRLRALLERLDLEEKVLLLTGRDFWTTWPLEKIGLRRMLLSDGPAGVRGEHWDERDPSLNLPSGTALGASWDPELAHRYGAIAAAEARRKGVDVVLGPTINLHRSPLGGRHFEAFSEDPVLTAELAAAYVDGVQSNGVAATPKHYVANDFETDRFTVDVRVEERALRELYLLAFEKAVTEAHAWVVMSAYNGINGATATENDLLETPLNSEWGFDGVVVSDWTAVRSIESARHAQDLVMPGPAGPWGDALVEAVRDGRVPLDAVDRKVLRLLALAARVGALEGFGAPVSPAEPAEDGIAFARHAAAEGMVLVANDGVLPVVDAPARIAVIGHNATVARTQGGGSATVVPETVVSPLDGIRAAFPDAVVEYRVGAVVQEGIAELPLAELTNPITGDSGVRVSFLDAAGTEIFAEDRRSTALVWIGSAAPVEQSASLRLSTRWTPAEGGELDLGFAAVGRARITLDGATVLDADSQPVGDDLGAALLSPGTVTAPVRVEAGHSYELAIEYRREVTEQFAGAMTFAFGLGPSTASADALEAEAESAAREADLVVLVVGTNSAVESEGFDRTSLSLPGRQDALAERVLAANPRSVVIVNAGAPVALPWRSHAGAVLLGWFGGQEFGNALGDVLTGRAEPGGRLPTTWADQQTDVPVIDVTPRDGVVEYREGIHIGYRAWIREGRTPAFPFGFGLGYTSWQRVGSFVEAASDEFDGFVVEVRLRNSGDRAGKQVVQVYASRTESAVDRPARWLVGWGVVRAGAGEHAICRIHIPRRAFAHWDGEWRYEAGVFELSIGFDVTDTLAAHTVAIA